MKMEADRSAKAYSKQEIIIDAAVVRVFKLIADINNWTHWQSSVKKVAITGELEEGKTFKWKANGVSMVSRLHTLSPFTEIGWTGKAWWVKAIHNWYLQQEEDGKCRVTVEESLTGFLTVLMKKSLRERMTKNLKELKLAAEKGLEFIAKEETWVK